MGWIEPSRHAAKPWRSVAWVNGRKFTKSFRHHSSANLWWRIAEAPPLTPAEVAALNAESEG